MLCHLVTLNWPKQALKSYLRSPLIKSNNTDHSSLNIWEFEEFLKLNCGLLRRRMKLKIFTLIIIPLILWLTKERFFSHKLVIRRKNFARQQKVFFWPEYFHFGSGSISDIYHHRITTKNHSLTTSPHSIPQIGNIQSFIIWTQLLFLWTANVKIFL